MRLQTAVFLFLLYESACAVQFTARLNMGGVTGQVEFNSTAKTATLKVSGAGSCSSIALTITEFPVKFGHYAQPCSEGNIGPSIYNFNANPAPNTVVNVSGLFALRSRLDDYSMTLKTCNGTVVCTVVNQGKTVSTLQARFTSSIAGNVYIRHSSALSNQWLLSDLVTVGQVNASETNVTLYSSLSTAASCKVLLSSLNNNSPSSNVGVLQVGTPLQLKKSRLDLQSFNTNTRFLLIRMNRSYICARVYNMPGKRVSAAISMRGIKGYISFYQPSPFEVTQVMVNLTNLRSKVAGYHVHLFPLPSVRNPLSSLCSNDNLGGHFNPFGVDTSSPSYPRSPGSTHDRYEIGDLSGKHMSLAGKNETDSVFRDYNLPLYGRNSIVGRSVVIHLTGGARYACASISYPGEVTVGRARFLYPVIGEVWFTQLKNLPLSDVSIFSDLSYGNPATAPTNNHNWDVHTYPISSERDDSADRCSTAGGHWNPHNIDTAGSLPCSPTRPLSCEVGDLSGKHTTLNLGVKVGGVAAKNFFTDVTAWVPGITNRSVVIHQAEGGEPGIACANVTMVRAPTASLGKWFGPGASDGQIRFSEAVPQGPTTVNVSLTGLNSQASGYHVHVLPIPPGSTDPCSNANILGHFNPLGFDTAQSPGPGVGTLDQYELGDLSGKHGTLAGRNDFQAVHTDTTLPLSGPYSIVRRSVVIHYTNGSRMRCADINADTLSDGHWVLAKADLNSTVAGTVRLRQQIFPYGSAQDTTIEMSLRSGANLTATNVSVHIMTRRTGGTNCSEAGGLYNPFNMTVKSTSCSLETPLGCVLGELSFRQGLVSLTKGQVFTDSLMPLSGDFTVVRRTVAVMSGGSLIACADILPESPSADQSFPRVTSFSRFDFRKRVANVLKIDMQRVTILPGSPETPANTACQRVYYMVAGNVNSTLLNSVKTSAMMGQFVETAACSAAAALLLPGRLLLAFVFAAVPFL